MSYFLYLITDLQRSEIGPDNQNHKTPAIESRKAAETTIFTSEFYILKKTLKNILTFK